MRCWIISRWKKIVGILVLAGIYWGLLVYAMDWPIEDHKLQVCEICRASRSVDAFFVIPMPIIVKENEFSRYYIRYSDANHRHSWRTASRHRISREHRTYGDGGLHIPYKMAWAILQSLPRGESQKQVMEKLSKRDFESPEDIRLSISISKLENAYYQDPNRKDWPAQLRKVGLYPNIDPKN